MKIRLHPSARLELDEAAAWYESHAGRDVAADFVTAYVQAAELLADRPEVGKPGQHESRSISLRRFPFRPVYRFNDGSILVLAIAHWRRRPNYWQRRR